jgi:TolB-like protein/DNA-binding winged helix-turn-helix (wHTH) protein
VKQVEQIDASGQMQGCASASLFGRFQLWSADGSEIVISNNRARALLAMLCLAKREAIDRDFLSKMLWHGRFEAHAKASLRQCLLEFGKLLRSRGTDILDVSRTTVSLHSGSIVTDLDRFEEAVKRADYSTATARLSAIGSKPILDQIDFGDAFNRWLSRYSADAERRLRDAVEGGLAALEQVGNGSARAQLSEAWSARNPTASAFFAPSKPSAANRIAVLPFQSIGATEGPDYFADGIVDELITTLGQVPQLLVAGRTSSFFFRGSALPPAQVAAKLGVLHLIEGSVQRQGDRVRIHAHLVSGETGFELWGAHFDGTLNDVFAFQERVAQAITAAIGNALGIAMRQPLVPGMTHSPEAYDLYLQGRSLSFKLFGNGVLDTAVALLEQAVAVDPDFAEAWLLLGEVHQLIGIYTACLDRPAESARMAASVARTLSIKPGLGQAYVLLGLHELTVGNFVGALDLAFKGYHLEPTNPAVAMRLGSYLLFCGRTTEGLRYIEEAIAQDPIDGRKYMLRCSGQLNRGDIAAAIADGQRAVDLGFPSMWLALANAAAGQRELAIDQYQQTRLLLNKTIFPPTGTMPMTPEVMDAYWLIAAKGVCSGKGEDREIYCCTLDYLHLTMHDSTDIAIALPAVFMGYADMFFKSIGQAVSLGNMGCLISLWADIEPIRQIWQHPEFIPFAQRIGMAAAWDKYGWPDLLPPPINLSAAHD